MKIRRYLNNLPKSFKNCVITIGNFDGVHLGHQMVIQSVLDEAKKQSLNSLIITFQPHPLKVLRPQIPLFHINSFKQKAKLLKKIGIKNLLCLNFNKKFSQITAKDFCQQVLKKSLNAKHIIIGYDFIFGKDRVGDNLFLQNFCQENNIKFTQITAKTNDEHAIYSSSLIRKYLQEGKTTKANELLGYSFYIEGRVIKGKKKASELGFPTANIKLSQNQIFIKKGVYVANVKVGIKNYKAVVNIGVKPTFGSNNVMLLEAHIFKFKKNIYGKKIKVSLINFIREEKKFESLDALKKQIANDISYSKKADAKKYSKTP